MSKWEPWQCLVAVMIQLPCSSEYSTWNVLKKRGCPVPYPMWREMQPALWQQLTRISTLCFAVCSLGTGGWCQMRDRGCCSPGLSLGRFCTANFPCWFVAIFPAPLASWADVTYSYDNESFELFDLVLLMTVIQARTAVYVCRSEQAKVDRLAPNICVGIDFYCDTKDICALSQGNKP